MPNPVFNQVVSGNTPHEQLSRSDRLATRRPSFASCSQRLRLPRLLQLESDLREAAQKVPHVPPFHEELTVGSHDDHAGEGHRQIRRRLAHDGAGVGALNTAVGGDAIALVEDLVDRHVEIRKRRSKLLVERLESLTAHEGFPIGGEPVYHGVRREQAIDRGGIATIPNLVEPATDERFGGLRHRRLLSVDGRGVDTFSRLVWSCYGAGRTRGYAARRDTERGQLSVCGQVAQ